MRNSPFQPRPGEPLETGPGDGAHSPVLARRQCEAYAEECAALAAQCQSTELRHLLLRVARGWRWLAGDSPP